MKEEIMKILLIINPVAGKGASIDLLDIYLPELAAEGRPVTVLITQEADEVDSLIKAYGQGYDRIMITGGDGSLNELASAVIRNDVDVDIAYLPMGTACDFAASLQFPDTILEKARLAHSAESKQLDLGKFQEEQYFIYCASFGIFTEVSYNTPTDMKNNIGKIAYFLNAIKNMGPIKEIQMQVQTDNEQIEGKFVFVAVLNTLQVGGLVKLNEDDVQFDDGYFELLMVKPPSTATDYGVIINALLTQDFSNDLFIYKKVKQCEFIFEEEIPWTLDGEFGGQYKNVSIDVLQKAWRLSY